jgi:MFS transporter, OFA family, oxalate/formate antiporter
MKGEMIMDQQKVGFYGWRNVVIIFFCYGLMLTAFWGYAVIFPAMIKSLGWARGDASVAHTIRTLIVGFGAPLCVYMIGRIGNRWTFAIGAAIATVVLFLLSSLPLQMWTWTILWGVCAGFAMTLAGQVVSQNIAALWFSKRRAFVMGIVMTAGPLGGFLVQPSITWIMSQTGRWQTGFFALAVATALAFVFVMFLKNKPSDYGQYPDGINPAEANAEGMAKKAMAKTYRTTDVWTLAEAMRTRTFWFLALGYCVASMPVYLITAHGILHLLDMGYTKMQGAYVISFYVLFAGIVRVPLGLLGDIIEPRWLLSAAMGLTLASLGVFWAAPNITALIIAASVLGATFSCSLTLMPVVIGNYFHADSFAKMNSVLYPLNIGCAAIVPAGVGYIHQFSKSYDNAYIIMLSLCAVALVCILLMAPPVKKWAMR